MHAEGHCSGDLNPSEFCAFRHLFPAALERTKVQPLGLGAAMPRILPSHPCELPTSSSAMSGPSQISRRPCSVAACSPVHWMDTSLSGKLPDVDSVTILLHSCSSSTDSIGIITVSLPSFDDRRAFRYFFPHSYPSYLHGQVIHPPYLTAHTHPRRLHQNVSRTSPVAMAPPALTGALLRPAIYPQLADTRHPRSIFSQVHESLVYVRVPHVQKVLHGL